MNFLVAKRADGFRVWFSVSTSTGVLRTGLGAGNFVVTLVNPVDSASASYTVSQSSEKAGLYFFDAPAAFLITHGVGDYVAVVEVSATSPKLNAVASTMVSVSEQDIDNLAAAVWDELMAGHAVPGSSAQLLKLVQAILGQVS